MHAFVFPPSDDSSPPRDRAAWKIGIAGIMRKPFEKKTPAGVTFGVRLDDCPPAQTNRVIPHLSSSVPIQLNIKTMLMFLFAPCAVCSSDRGGVLQGGGGERPGVHGHLPRAREQRRHLQHAGGAQQQRHDWHRRRGRREWRTAGRLGALGLLHLHPWAVAVKRSLPFTSLQKWRDLNVISSLLKSFFRKLPDPLFTNGEILVMGLILRSRDHELQTITGGYVGLFVRLNSKERFSCFIHRKVRWFYWSQQNRRLSGEIKGAQEAGEWGAFT